MTESAQCDPISEHNMTTNLHGYPELPRPNPILAASCRPLNACKRFERANKTPSDIAAKNTLHAMNSQKSARSASGIRPQDSHAGVSPCKGGVWMGGV